ncbi:MAG TPA: DUF3828 domain-containing protein [Pyrinomonadaceae bacterium]|nr:DUF3828 domain-containing protein [Pyrinomonadaceae bacterium]
MLIGLFGGTDARAQNGAAKGAQPAAADPAAVVRELYKVHRNGNGPVFTKKGRKYQEQFFDQKLAGLIWKDLTETPAGEVGHIDGDPLFNAQDMKITKFAVGAASVNGDAATVPVTFMNYDQKVKITFQLVKTGTGWKISNILYGDGSDFVKILSEPM